MKENPNRFSVRPTLIPCPKAVEAILNRRFGKLVVIGYSGAKTKFGQSLAVCKCDCGQFVNVPPFRLKTGNTTSCGCTFSAKVAERNTAGVTHGHSKGGKITAEYRAWQAMINRCYNPKDARYKWYGARGITVCDRWQSSFEDFLKDVGARPPKMSLERTDNNKGYEPSNVVWASAKVQARNQRNTVRYGFKGEQVTLGELADRFQIEYDILRQRIEKFGWPLERAVAVPIGKGGRYPTKEKSLEERLYAIWYEIKSRCTNSKHPRFDSYGGRGIRMCEEWKDSFERFLTDIGIPPNELCTLDRKDNDGNYEPTNVRWATAKEQNRNRRSTKRYELNGESKTLAEWAELAEIPYSRVKQRVLTYKWDLNEALGTPIGGSGRMPKADRVPWKALQ